ncbi:MAG: penicillin-binding protein [Sphingomonadales bacterium]|jgi:cell division protein FtsI (penicillin-binding protein 3)
MSNQENAKVNTRRAILLRAYLVFGIVLVFGFSVLFTAAKLQLGTDEDFSKEMQQKNTRTIDVKAIRGNIYAADGSLLATSVPRYNMVFDAMANGLTKDTFRKYIDSLSLLMAYEFKERNAAEWKDYFTSLRSRKSRYAVVVKDQGYDVVKKMKTWPLIRKGKFKGGFWFDEQGKRLYFMGDLAKRTIGYSKQGVYVGLEGAFDSLLRGTDGQRMEQRMPGNIWRPMQTGNGKDPVNGYDIVTTLDVNLQDVAQNALQRVLASNEADHGCAVVMEVKTGAIKAMANLKRNEKGEYVEVLNYAVDEFEEPGSTFKLVSTMALLEDGYAKSTDSVDVQGGEVKMYGETMKDATKPNKRILTLQESFEKSSNVGISKLVLKHYAKQPEKFVNHAFRLGLHFKPDFDIRTPNNPLIKTKKSKNWYNTTLPWMSIGYETKISPLQMLMLYNAVANNGKMMRPYMVSEIRHEGKLIKNISPEVVNEKICSDKTLSALKSMMEGVVDHGTATNLRNENYQVAGKTGTAKIAKGKAYAEGSYKASFAGYFPAQNPQYSIIVVINEPKKGTIYGALVAGPVFKDIADKIYSSSLKIQPVAGKTGDPQIPEILKGSTAKTKQVLNLLNISSMLDSGTQSEWVSGSKKGFAVLLKPAQVKQGLLPEFKGMGLRDAIVWLEQHKISVSSEGYGRIVSQSIPAGTALSKVTQIHLTLQPF